MGEEGERPGRRVLGWWGEHGGRVDEKGAGIVGWVWWGGVRMEGRGERGWEVGA